jgi:hypothetical protein
VVVGDLARWLRDEEAAGSNPATPTSSEASGSPPDWPAGRLRPGRAVMTAAPLLAPDLAAGCGGSSSPRCAACPRTADHAEIQRRTPEDLPRLRSRPIAARDASRARTRMRNAAFPVTKTLERGSNARVVRIVTRATLSLVAESCRLTQAWSRPPRGIRMVPSRRAATGVTTARGCVVLAAAAIMLTACGGQHTAAPVTTSPAASSPRAHSSSPAAATGSVRLPAQLLGLAKNTSAAAKQAITIVGRQFASRLAEDVVGGQSAIYGGEQNGAMPFFFVTVGRWVEHVASPDDVAHTLQDFMRTKGFTDVRVLPPGPDGETLVCGQKHVTAGTDTVCYWADHVSLGLVLYSPGFVSSLSDAASKTSQIHSSVVS